jgi:hypothetical protein
MYSIYFTALYIILYTQVDRRIVTATLVSNKFHWLLIIIFFGGGGE